MPGFDRPIKFCWILLSLLLASAFSFCSLVSILPFYLKKDNQFSIGSHFSPPHSHHLWHQKTVTVLVTVASLYPSDTSYKYIKLSCDFYKTNWFVYVTDRVRAGWKYSAALNQLIDTSIYLITFKQNKRINRIPQTIYGIDFLVPLVAFCCRSFVCCNNLFLEFPSVDPDEC